jgi:hypothetical protein
VRERAARMALRFERGACAKGERRKWWCLREMKGWG